MLFKNSLPALLEVKPEYDARLALFNEELQSSINTYNTIVVNLARKFHPLTKQIINKYKLNVNVNDLTFRNLGSPVTPGMFTFVRQDGTTVNVPSWKLSRNSWVIASTIRKQIREMQRKQLYEEAQTARSRLSSLKGTLTKAKRELESAEKIMDRADKLYADKTVFVDRKSKLRKVVS